MIGSAWAISRRVESTRRGATAERARTLAAEMGERDNEAEALRILGDTGSRDHLLTPADAVEHYQRALRLAEPRRMRPLVAHCLFGLGRLEPRAPLSRSATTPPAFCPGCVTGGPGPRQIFRDIAGARAMERDLPRTFSSGGRR